ncbi:MAG: M6 family metalloprotease domain-containing protein [candidate division WOR-3 bacterium]
MKILITFIFLMPPHPNLKNKLTKENWDKMVKVLKEAREKGVNQPDYENLEKFRIRILMKQQDTANVPVILVEFTDNLADSTVTHFEDMLFSVGTYSTGSLTDYYLENSYGNFFIKGWVSNWLMMPQTYSYYVDGQYGFGSYPRNAQGLARDAVLAADPYVDFSQFDRNNDGYIDGLFIVHAGPGAEETGNPNDIWSHAWVIPGGVQVDGVIAYRYSMEPENGRMGVFGHEYGHVLGLPDLYDTDYSSEGLGNWSMMAGGSWGNNGRTPVHFDVWCKYKLGFLSPTNVTSIINNALFLPVENSPIAYRLWTNGANSPQYFLVEYRKKIKFDSYLPGEGLLIFHIDENQPNNRNEWYPGHTSFGHYKVALEQADGNWDLEKNNNPGDPKDPFPGSTNKKSFDNYTIPDSKDYNFNTTYVSVTGITYSNNNFYADLAVVPVYNISVDSSNFPLIIKKDSLINPIIYVSNRGFYSQNFNLTLRIDSLSIPVYEYQIQGLTLSPGSSSFYSFPVYKTKFSNGIYNINAYITSLSEQMFKNDTLKQKLFSYELINFLNSPFSSVPPTIDGIIEPNEWSSAYILDISDYLKIGGKRNIQESFLYIKNSENALYLGIKVKDTTSGSDYIRIIFDDNADGKFPPSPNTSEGEIKFQQSGSSFTATFIPYFTGGQQGQSHPLNLNFAISEIGEERHFEIEIPFSLSGSGLDEYLNVNSSIDTFGFFIMGRNSSEADINPYWLQNIPLTQIKNPSLYGKVRVQNVNVGIKEGEISYLKEKLNVEYVKEGIKIIYTQPDYSPYEIKILDLTGRILFKTKVKNKKLTKFLPYKESKKGIYFVIIEKEKGKLKRKFIIN